MLTKQADPTTGGTEFTPTGGGAMLVLQYVIAIVAAVAAALLAFLR